MTLWQWIKNNSGPIGAVVAVLGLVWAIVTFVVTVDDATGPPAQTIEASGAAQVQTGDGTQVRTGDNSPVSIGSGAAGGSGD